MSDPRALYRHKGVIGTVAFRDAFPITAHFGKLRIDFESVAAAKRWLGEQLAHCPEQDRLGWFTKHEHDPAGPSWEHPQLAELAFEIPTP